MKKRRVKYSIIIVTCMCVCILMYYQYRSVNVGVAKDFYIEKYSMGENVELDNFEIKINSISKKDGIIDGSKNPYAIDLTIKNISDENQTIKQLITDSKILVGNYIIEVPLEVNGDGKSQLEKKDERRLEIVYEFPFQLENREIEFYVPKEFYKLKIQERLDMLQMNEKYIALKIN